MTISSTTRKASYSGNGSTTAFSVSFKYLTKSDIVVELIVDSTGVTTTQVLDTDYSLTSPGDSGTVTMTTAPATGETLLISRQMSIVQETDYVENDPFPANTHEEALDRLTMICQELDESIKRALALPLSSTTSDLSVPEPVAERFLGWNDAGTALENKIIGDGSLIVLPLSLANGGTNATTASSARTNLELEGRGVVIHSNHITATSSQSVPANSRAEISNLTLTLTPKSTTSKFLIFGRWVGEMSITDNSNVTFGLKRGSTDIGAPASAGNRNVGFGPISQGLYNPSASDELDSWTGFYVDSPSTTSSITYKVTLKHLQAHTLYNNRTVNDTDATNTERGTSSLIALEIIE